MKASRVLLPFCKPENRKTLDIFTRVLILICSGFGLYRKKGALLIASNAAPISDCMKLSNIVLLNFCFELKLS